MSSEPHIFFNEVNERQGVFNRRALLFGGMATLGVAGLSARLMKLQLLDNSRNGHIDAALQVHRVHTGGSGFGALADNRLG